MPTDGNLLARLALPLWVPISLLAFSRMRPPLAAAVLSVFGTLFLPERIEFDFAALPPFDKYSVVTVWVLIGCFMHARPRLQAARVGSGVDKLILLLIVGAICTTLTNGDVLSYGPKRIPAQGVQEAISMIVRDLLYVAVPFIVGRALYTSERDVMDLLRVFIVGALIYSLFVLVELRMSPQFHNWTYGFAQHKFGQTARGEGWRPMVYMGHGLGLALFICVGLLSAQILVRLGLRVGRLRAGVAVVYLAVILAACKSVAAIVYACTVGPVLYFAAQGVQRRMALVLAVVIITYPLLRTAGLFPTEGLTDLAASFSAERAESLDFRFYNEDALLEKMSERVWFGWALHGRGRIYHERTGEDITVLDGYWIVRLAERGAAGFLGEFGILVAPIFLLGRRLQHITSEKQRSVLCGLVLIQAAATVDLLPNGLYTFFPFMLSGALLGVSSKDWAATRPRRASERAPASEEPIASERSAASP